LLRNIRPKEGGFLFGCFRLLGRAQAYNGNMDDLGWELVHLVFVVLPIAGALIIWAARSNRE